MATAWHANTASLTDPGRRHSENDDRYGAFTPDDPTIAGQVGRLFVVADGDSGYGGGHEASELAVASIIESYASADDKPLGERLIEAVQAGNRAVCGRRKALAGGGQPRSFLATVV